MPFRSGVPRTTHTWLKPLYDYLDDGVVSVVPSGASGIANAAWLGSNVPISQVGNASGTVGFYGGTGIAKIASAGLFVTSASALGASGMQATGLGESGLYTHLARAAWNGGSGTAYTIHDLVAQLKNMNILTP